MGKVLKNATGEKSTKSKIQVLFTVKLGETQTQQIFIVVPKLIKDCINMILGTVSEKIQVMIEIKKYEIPLCGYLRKTYGVFDFKNGNRKYRTQRKV